MRISSLVALTLVVLIVGCDLPGKPKPDAKRVRPKDVKDFATLYHQNCAACHGSEGKAGPAPPLNDRLFLAMISDDELKRVIAEGRSGTPMPAFAEENGGTLTAQQVQILAEKLKETWGSREPPERALPPYLTPAQELASSSREAGLRIFARACADCHGAQGQGAADAGAINDPDFLMLISDQALRRVIITGRPDLKTKMPNYAEKSGRDEDFQPLTSREITDLVTLLATWRKNESPVRK